MKRVIKTIIASLALSLCMQAYPFQGFVGKSLNHISQEIDYVSQRAGGQSKTVPATGEIEVAFSPKGGAEALVVKTIDSAQSEIKMLAYSFTSAPVVNALLDAKRRGVSVTIVVDEKNNITDDRSGKARAALSALTNAGCDVRIIGVYQIHHDKVIIVDKNTVELGSFNFSYQAENKNSENVLVNWHNSKLADVYLSHFDRNYRQSSPYHTRY